MYIILMLSLFFIRVFLKIFEGENGTILIEPVIFILTTIIRSQRSGNPF